MTPCNPEIFLPEVTNIQIADCTEEAQFCIPVPFSNLQDYNYLLNGEAYTGPMTACDIDTFYVYSYNTLFGQGNSGPYQIDSWLVNGVNITGTFHDIHDLVMFMNDNDPLGNWVDIPSLNFIQGGNSSSTYTSMEITVISISSPTFMGLNAGLVNGGTMIELPVGLNELIAIDIPNACTDTIMVNVGCVDCDVIVEVVDQAGSPLPYLIAENVAGQPPFTYMWNSGESTAGIFPTESGTYCVYMSDANGCSAESCEVVVIDPPVDSLCHVDFAEYTTASGAIGLEIISQSGTTPFTYEWNNGQTGNEIIITYSDNYCVSMTDADGCVAVACETIILEPCQVFITQSTNPNGVVVLEANWASNDLPTFEWSTGSNSSSINVFNDGTYCVTATFPNGCVATACYTYVENPIDTSCFVFITEEVGSGGIDWLYANAEGGVPPYTYLWQDGTTNASIMPTLGANHCVTITDANGCASEDCIYINGFHTIQGNVWTDSLQGINTGTVFLIQFDPIDSTLTLVNSTAFSSAISSGYYYFGSLSPGSYLMKAALDENAVGYETHLPTYHYDQLFWHEATEINVPVSTVGYTNIEMVQGNNPGGPGFIGGYVTEGANKPDNTTTDVKDPGDPIPNVSILLLDVNDNPITHTVTNSEGRYEFDDLPYGTYKVFVEIWGKDQGMQIVTIDANTPTADPIDFNVNSTYTTTSIAEINEVKSVKIYPNPTTESDVLNVALDMTTFEELTLEIIHVNGNKLFSTQESVSSGVNIIQLNTKDLASGVYFLNVKSSNGVMTRKFVR